MKNLITISILFLFAATACNSAPDGFCECLQKGKELDAITQDVLSAEATEQMKKKMLDIRAEKKKACAQFETSSGPQMMEWQKACAD